MAKQRKAEKTKPQPASDLSTEERIKNAARQLFHKKGFAATRTRDIAEATGINLALLNYYFRSKQKLYDLIMLETLQGFLQNLKTVFDNPDTSFEEKIDQTVQRYIDLLLTEPDIPLFILSELRSNPGDLLDKMGAKNVLLKSLFLRQFQDLVDAGEIAPIHPLQFIMNLIGMTVFPFVASPLIMGLGDLSQQQFNSLMIARKTIIPKSIKAALKAT